MAALALVSLCVWQNVVVLKKGRVLKWVNGLISANCDNNAFFLLGSYFQTMPDEDPFCASLPSELCWGVHSNSSLCSCRLCKVGGRTSRDLLYSTEQNG